MPLGTHSGSALSLLLTPHSVWCCVSSGPGTADKEHVGQAGADRRLKYRDGVRTPVTSSDHEQCHCGRTAKHLSRGQD
jgi:hypothetical protein